MDNTTTVYCHRDTPIEDFISDIMDRSQKTGRYYRVCKYGAEVIVYFTYDYSDLVRRWYADFQNINCIAYQNMS